MPSAWFSSETNNGDVLSCDLWFEFVHFERSYRGKRWAAKRSAGAYMYMFARVKAICEVFDDACDNARS